MAVALEKRPKIKGDFYFIKRRRLEDTTFGSTEKKVNSMTYLEFRYKT